MSWAGRSYDGGGPSRAGRPGHCTFSSVDRLDVRPRVSGAVAGGFAANVVGVKRRGLRPPQHIRRRGSLDDGTARGSRWPGAGVASARPVYLRAPRSSAAASADCVDPSRWRRRIPDGVGGGPASAGRSPEYRPRPAHILRLAPRAPTGNCRTTRAKPRRRPSLEGRSITGGQDVIAGRGTTSPLGKSSGGTQTKGGWQDRRQAGKDTGQTRRQAKGGAGRTSSPVASRPSARGVVVVERAGRKAGLRMETAVAPHLPPGRAPTEPPSPQGHARIRPCDRPEICLPGTSEADDPVALIVGTVLTIINQADASSAATPPSPG